MKKIVLFSPKPSEFTFYGGAPLSLLGLARFLAYEKDFKIKIIKATPKFDYMKELIKESEDAVCVGISSMTGYQIKEALIASKEIKSKYPYIPIIWGGWHSTILPLETLKDPNVDIVVIGQGERAFNELVKAIVNKKSLLGVKGVWFKKNGAIIKNPYRDFEDINNFPPLPYNIIDDIEDCIKHTELGTRTLNYISSIGCPFRCAFCAEKMISNRRWFGLQPERVVNEIEKLIKDYNINGLYISDSNFFVDKKRVEEICKGIIERGIKIRIGRVNGRPDQLSKFDDKLWSLLKKAGFYSILIGAETHSQEILEVIHKDTTIKDTLNLMRVCDKYDIKLTYSFMIGLPLPGGIERSKNFVKEDFRKTVEFINFINKNSKNYSILLFIYTPYPGTELFEMSRKYGVQVPDDLYSWSKFNLHNQNTPWVPKKYISLINQLSISILPYLPRKREDRHIYAKILHHIATIRMKTYFFGLPIEYFLMKLYIDKTDFKKKRWDL
ncbi:MAG: radical SAM protein [Candidatus Woesearchaeota archaeon]